MKTLVSAHNTLFGSRFFGVYASTLKEWPVLQAKYECFFVADDLVGHFVQPVDSAYYADNAQVVAGEFLASGIKASQANIALASELPEMFELAFLLGKVVDFASLEAAYLKTVGSNLDLKQRSQLGLPRTQSFGEIVYPHLGISSYVLGLQADVWQGGAEISINHKYISDIATAFNKATAKKALIIPKLMLAKFSSVRAADGSLMTYANGLRISSSESEIKQYLDQVESVDVLSEWATILGVKKFAQNLKKKNSVYAEDRAQVADLVIAALAPYAQSKVTNGQVVRALSKGSRAARDRIQETIKTVKEAMGIQSYTSRLHKMSRSNR